MSTGTATAGRDAMMGSSFSSYTVCSKNLPYPYVWGPVKGSVTPLEMRFIADSPFSCD